MNITCHSSFDTNLRIRMSTPGGQKIVESKQATEREPKPGRQQNPEASQPSLGPYDGRGEPFAANFRPQFDSFSFA